MFKISALLLTLVVASFGLPSLLPVTIPNQAPVIPIPVLATPAPLPAVQSSLSAFLNYVFNALYRGVSVPNPLGSGSLSVGEMVLPVNALCVDNTITRDVACHVCWQDCVYVHNKYGGQCEFSQAAQEQRCNCYEGAFPTVNNTVVTTAENLCGPIVDGTAVAMGVTDNAIRVAFVARYDYLQCSEALASATGTNVNNGCNVDCTGNHQYVGGYGKCVYQSPVAPDATSTAEMAFCTCGFSNATTTSPY